MNDSIAIRPSVGDSNAVLVNNQKIQRIKYRPSAPNIRNSGCDKLPFLKTQTKIALLTLNIARPTIIGDRTIFSKKPIVGNKIALIKMSPAVEIVTIKKRIVQSVSVGIKSIAEFNDRRY